MTDFEWTSPEKTALVPTKEGLRPLVINVEYNQLDALLQTSAAGLHTTVRYHIQHIYVKFCTAQKGSNT